MLDVCKRIHRSIFHQTRPHIENIETSDQQWIVIWIWIYMYMYKQNIWKHLITSALMIAPSAGYEQHIKCYQIYNETMLQEQ